MCLQLRCNAELRLHCNFKAVAESFIHPSSFFDNSSEGKHKKEGRRRRAIREGGQIEERLEKGVK